MPINDSSPAHGGSRADRTNDDSGSTELQSLSAKLPGYEVTREIRGGAQGVVYEAIQESTGRKVAIKVMKQGPLAGSAERARFEREVRILGQIQHPNIVGILATGIAAGCHYYVMDFISGLALSGYMAENKRSIDETLRLFAKICQAISAAHLRGIIHRDLKPTNIVVDPDGQPHVLDFGLAKFSRSEADVDMSVTQSGQFVGTPAYAAPEQVRLEHDLVDGRTDLYSLGMILFQMLTGAMPYPISSDIRRLVDTIEHTPPQRPSRLNPRIGRDLDSILLKALSKEKSNRYQSATAFAADIRRYLAGQSVQAHPPSALYQMRKLIYRHRLPFAFAATVLLLLTMFAIVSTVLAVRLFHQRELALTKGAEARRQRDHAEQMTRESELHAADARARASEARWQAYLANLAAADAALRMGDATAARAARRRLDNVTDHTLINWEWWHLIRRMDRIENSAAPPDVVTFDEGALVNCLAFSPQGNRIAIGRADGIVTLRRIGPAGGVLRLRGHSAAVRAVTFDPTGERLASASADGTVRLWATGSGEAIMTVSSREAEASAVTFDFAAKRLIAGYSDASVIVWSADGREMLAELPGHTAGILALTGVAQTDLAVSAGLDATMRVWNTQTFTQIGNVSFRGRSVHALAVSPDGKLLACGLADGRIVITEFGSWETVARLDGHVEPVSGLAFSPDGTRLASVSADTTLRLWDVARQEEVIMLRGHQRPVTSVAFSPDGARIATASTDGAVRILEARVSADDFVRQMANDLSPSEIIEFLEADDALEGPLRDTALRIARRLNADHSATRSTNP